MLHEPQQEKNVIPYPRVTNDNLAQNYAPGPRIRVRCIAPQGLYYNFLRRRENDEFLLHPMYVIKTDKKTGKAVKKDGEFVRKVVTARDQFSEENMEILEEEADPQEKEVISSAQQAVTKGNADVESLKRGPGRPAKNA